VELFEILFILFFILIPVFEGIRKGRQRRGSGDIELPGEAEPRQHRQPGGGGRMGQRTAEDWDTEVPQPRREPEPADAADMVPDDLWEVLTGERRQPRPPVPAPPPDPAETWDDDDAPWVEEPRWERAEDVFAKERFEPAPWEEDRDEIRLDPRTESPFPTAEPPVVIAVDPYPPTPRRRVPLSVVLETPRTPRRVSPLMRALQHPDGLRQAVLLREILGPPKGLETPGEAPHTR